MPKQTIVFYSYKGGMGRSLTLANIATILAYANKKVVVLDFDLEAPGLHYKFGLAQDKVKRGLVGYLVDYLTGESVRLANLWNYMNVVNIEGNNLYLLPSGKAPSNRYCENLFALNVNDLLFLSNENKVDETDEVDGLNETVGGNILLSLLGRISKEIKPDVILVDCRTGITALGILTLTYLADKIVCFLSENKENISGTKWIMNNIFTKTCKENKIDLCPNIFPVIGHMPEMINTEEGQIQERVLKQLKKGVSELMARKLHNEINFLRHFPDISIKEEILVGSSKSPKGCALLNDYYHLISSLELTNILGKKLNNLLGQIAEYEYPELVSESNDKTQHIYWMDGKYVFDDSLKQKRGKEKSIYNDVRKRKKIIEAEMKWNAPAIYNKFIREIKQYLALECNLIDDTRSSIGSVYDTNVLSAYSWTMISYAMSKAAFHFWGEPFYLTSARSHFASVVQLGWLDNYSCLALPDKRIEKILNNGHNIKDIVKTIKRQKMQVGVLPDTAASEEIIRIAIEQNCYEAIITLGPEDNLQRWMLDKTMRHRRIVFCDNVVANEFKRMCANIDDANCKLDLLHKIYEFTMPLPVGFVHPKNDLKWRETISKAFAMLIYKKGFNKLWGTPKLKNTVCWELSRVGMRPKTYKDLKKTVLSEIDIYTAIRL